MNWIRRSRTLSLLTIATAFAVQPASALVNGTIKLTPDIDTHVRSSSNTDRQTETTMQASNNSSDTRIVYIKFTVPARATDSLGATREIAAAHDAYTAKLYLYKQSDSHTGGELTVSAGNNGWWATRTTTVSSFYYNNNTPTTLDQLDSKSGSSFFTNAGWISFDVTPYISGPGDYTFVVKTTAATNIHFRTKEYASYEPYLELTVGSSTDVDSYREYVRRQVVDVRSVGQTFVDRYELANPTDGAVHTEMIGYIDPTRQPYNLKATGDKTDNFYALQRAINEARDARMAVFVPAGEYTIADQLNFIQGLIPYPNGGSAPYPSEIQGERWDINDFPCVIIGEQGSSRSVLKLADNAPGFTSSATDPKAFLYFWSRWNMFGTETNPNNTPPSENRLASHFNQSLSNIDLKFGTGNAKAVGIDMGGAQGTSLRDSNINLTNAMAGLRALPGPGGLTENVVVTGGSYGVYTVPPSGVVIGDVGVDPVLTACKFINQTTAAIHWTGNQGLVLVGCEIESQLAGTHGVITIDGASSSLTANVAMIDCKVTRTTAGPIVTGPGGADGDRSVYMRDVYGYKTNVVARTVNADATNDPDDVPGNATGWTHVKEYSDGIKIDQSDYSGIGAEYVRTYIDGTVQPTTDIYHSIDTSITSAPDVYTLHKGPRAPRWDDSAVLNVKSTAFGARGNNVLTEDDTSAIQTALDAAAVASGPKYVFLPRGEYFISNTLEVENGIVFFGIDKSFSRLKHVYAPGDADTFYTASTGGYVHSNGSKSFKAMVHAGLGSGADKVSRTVLSDFMIFLRMSEDQAYALDWEVGRNSAVRNMNFDRRNVGTGTALAHGLVRIHGNGGGQWYNFWNDSDAAQTEYTGNQATAYHHLTIENTNTSSPYNDGEPLRFYMLNTETDTNTAQIFVRNASNIDIYQTKWEADKRDDGGTNDSPFLHVTDTSNFRLFGLGGNAHMANDTDTRDFAFEFVDTSDYLVAQQNMQFSRQATWQFNWIRNTTGATTTNTRSEEQFVLYRRGDPQRLQAVLNPSPASSYASEDGWVVGVTTGLGSGNTAGGWAALKVGDDATNRTYKSIMSFDTAALPDDAVVEKVTLRVRVGEILVANTTANLGNLEGEIKSGVWGSDGVVRNADFEATGGAAAFSITKPATEDDWIDIPINNSALGQINKLGRTQIRLSFATKTDNDSGQDTVSFYSMDNGIEDNRPTLQVFYTLPHTPTP